MTGSATHNSTPNGQVQHQNARGIEINWNRQKEFMAALAIAIVIGMISIQVLLSRPDKLVASKTSQSNVSYYSPPKPLFKNITDLKQNTTHCNFVEAMMKIEIEDVHMVVLEEMDNFRARLDFADSESSSELDSQNLGEMWQALALELNLLVHHSRFVNIKGKWEMQLLFEEYYAFNQANLAARLDSPTLMMANLIRIVKSLLEISDQITRVILEASKINAQVRRLLYAKGKKLSNTINQSGILQHGLRLIFGDMWVRQRKFELSLVHEGIEISKAVGRILGRFDMTFKIYNEAGKLLLGSIDRVMQEPQPSKTLRSLVILFSIFKCNQGPNVIFQYKEAEAPKYISSRDKTLN